MEFLDVVLPYITDILAAALIALIGVGGTWLTMMISKKTELASINEAVNQVVYAAQQTVGELQQTFVSTWKAEASDGKLTPSQVDELKARLLLRTRDKLSVPVVNILEAASVDLKAIIQGAAEAAISNMK